MVPKKLRSEVLILGHEGILAGHLGIKNSSDRILKMFLLARITRGYKKILSVM